jgi:Zn-dependent protease with chaperone function
MHDDLLEVAARRARAWLVLLAVVAALGPAVLVGVVAGPVAGVVAGVVAAAGLLVWILNGAPGIRRAAWPTAGLAPAGTEVAGIAAGIALATGREGIPAWEVTHAAPNVGAFRSPSGLALIVTDGARELLTRDQLEAVCATQLAIAADPTCHRLDGAVGFVRLVRATGFVVVVTLGLTLVFLLPIALVGLATVPASVGAWLVGGRVRWWARVASDAVCVRTTRHPEPLVAALRLLARSSGEQVPVGLLTRWLGVGGSQWAVELGPTWTSQVSVNGRLVDQRTSELVEDTRLLVRAALVRRVLLEHDEASVASYQEVAAAVRRAGRAAATGGSAEIHGELVGLEGVVTDRELPPAGWQPDPRRTGGWRWWDGTAWTDDTR